MSHLIAASDIFLENPAGLFGLAAIPVILAIHFLQTKARRIVVSTLFLLEEIEKESLGGRYIERLRSSVPLWLQLLIALLITFILADPLWIRKESVQSVVVLLDASISMEAFRKNLGTRVSASLQKLAVAASKTEWSILDTDRVGSPIYNGEHPDEALRAIEKWRPRLGTHETDRAFSLARGRAGERGIVVFVTDRPTKTPEGITLLAIGEKIENRGFSGARLGRTDWEASLMNYGPNPATIRWRQIGPAGAEMRSETITLDAGSSNTITGTYDTDAFRLEIDPDNFPVDDVLPIVKPRDKTIRVRLGNAVPFFEEVCRLEPNLKSETDPTKQVDLTFSTYSPLSPTQFPGNAILSVREPSKEGKTQQGEIAASRDPLVSDLAWQGLTIRDSLQAPVKKTDRVLVWQADRPLIYVRKMGTSSQLIFNFDLEQSNARRIPAVVVLVQRFIRLITEETPGLEVANYEGNQRIQLATNASAEGLRMEIETLPGSEKQTETIAKDSARVLRAPVQPAFLSIRQGEEFLLKGASHFADVREADFTDAASLDQTTRLAGELRVKNAEEDFLSPVWILLACAALLGNYAWLGRRR